MSNSKAKSYNILGRFKKAHKKIYNHLQKITDERYSDSGFKDLVEVAARKENPIVQRYKSDLIKFNVVRNILVHEDKIDSLKEEAVSKFEKIADRICSPERLIPKFRREVDVFRPGDELMNALGYMRENNFSQIALRDEDGLLSVLTVEGVSRWLEQEAERRTVDVATATVGDALAHEVEDCFICMSSSRTVYAARRAFAKAPEEQGSRLFAIIVTNTGSRDQSPLGIGTPWDLVDVSL
jgi:hypothetical protein